MNYPKFVSNVNTRDIELAIREGCRPMQNLLDHTKDNLPFFGNTISGSYLEDGSTSFGNEHNPNFDTAHAPGRWLNALLNAERVLGVCLDEHVIAELQRWAYRAMEDLGADLPCNFDAETMQAIPTVYTHNLREQMHALYALSAYRNDSHAHALALRLISVIDKYYDYENVCWDVEALQNDTGVFAATSAFPVDMGRYIGPLVKLYRATGETRALEQAIRLKDVAFRSYLNEKGDYDPLLFGDHTHSTTAMLSSLAQLGQTLNDESILRRVKAFMENGVYQFATDFGWCIEGIPRSDLRGEINNTADMMETCLILGQAGYPGFFARAERILRGHLLPSQLLDTSFIPADDDPSHVASYHLNEIAKGAFGFPAPYGHQSHPGSWVSYNWDIVGGGVGGLCAAYESMHSKNGNLLSINLLFDQKDEDFTFLSPYGRKDVAEITLHTPGTARVRIPTRCDVSCIQASCTYFIDGEWLYLQNPPTQKAIQITLPLKEEVVRYPFRQYVFTLKWRGEEVIAAESNGKNLCFFPEL